MSTCLQLVSEQFPHLSDRVASLFEGDAVFRELCEDYEACTNALARQPAPPGFVRSTRHSSCGSRPSCSGS